MTDTSQLKLLGEGSTQYCFDEPNANILERFAAMSKNQLINITCPEFTSLCPKTRQPDFATIEIRYKPNVWCVESKSLKLYLFSFRNHGEFHESCVDMICRDLANLLKPQYLSVKGVFMPRGGISIVPESKYYADDDGD